MIDWNQLTPKEWNQQTKEALTKHLPLEELDDWKLAGFKCLKCGRKTGYQRVIESNYDVDNLECEYCKRIWPS